MDFVPRDRRARWKSVEAISSFGWCGSALVGGIVSDSFSYVTTFGATAALQLASALLSLLLILVVPRREKDLQHRHRTSSPVHSAIHSEDDSSMDFRAEDDALTTASSDDIARISLPSVKNFSSSNNKDKDDLREPLLSL